MEIVAACQFKNAIYIFCRNGDVYRMDVDFDGSLRFMKMHELFHS